MKKHYREENDCLNCGTTLEGKFCYNCGQENLQIKESFGHMMTHAISDYFHFDHQFFHTLKPLLFNPGKLTTEYMAGHRVQYLHPVKMYIFISLVYFVLLFKSNTPEIVKITDSEANTEQSTDSLKTTLKNGINNSVILSPAQKKVINNKVDFKADSIKNANAVAHKKDTIKTYQQYLAVQQKLPANKRDNFIEQYLEKKQFQWAHDGKSANEIINEGMKHNLPKMMFLFLPLFALILKIAFIKNKKFYVEYLIYSFHFHCFLFLFITILMVIQLLIPHRFIDVIVIMDIAALLTILWYMYRSLRVVYGRSPLRTVTKMIGISFSYFVVFAICLTLLAGVTALTSL